MNREMLDNVFHNAVRKLRELAPKDSGHLSLNAIKSEWVSDTHFRIYIDEEVLMHQENIRGRVANYNYQARINEDVNYRTYKWFEKAVQIILDLMAKELQGEIR